MNILTWNTQWCCGMDGKVSVARIVQHALQMGEQGDAGGLDVLCLQEIAVNYPGLQGRPGDQLSELQTLLPGWQVFLGAPIDEFTAQGHQRFGNVIATRLPVLQVQHYPLPMPADANMRCMQRMCSVVTVRDTALGPVRIMTTHLEYFSKRQRMEQAMALRDLQIQACALADAPPQPASDGTPYQTKPHTRHAVLCGDFNFEPHEPEYAALSAPWSASEQGSLQPGQWLNSWSVLHGDAPQPPTFRLLDRTWGAEPGACDLIWVSESLSEYVQAWRVDSSTQSSDHQPVMLTLA